MIEIVGLDHIVLRTSRMEEMLHFYGAVLGCPVERELSPEFGLVQLRAGTALIDLVAVDSELGRAGGGPPTDGDNNMDHFCLQINMQPEEEISRYLESHGIKVGPFERRYGAQGYGNSVYLGGDTDAMEMAKLRPSKNTKLGESWENPDWQKPK